MRRAGLLPISKRQCREVRTPSSTTLSALEPIYDTDLHHKDLYRQLDHEFSQRSASAEKITGS
jgi:hypothetical protein